MRVKSGHSPLCKRLGLQVPRTQYLLAGQGRCWRPRPLLYEEEETGDTPLLRWLPLLPFTMNGEHVCSRFIMGKTVSLCQLYSFLHDYMEIKGDYGAAAEERTAWKVKPWPRQETSRHVQ